MTPSELAAIMNELRVMRETLQALFAALQPLITDDPFEGAVDVDSSGEE